MDTHLFHSPEAQKNEESAQPVATNGNGHITKETGSWLSIDLGSGVKGSETLGKLAGALARAQLEFKPIYKANDNPAFRSKYADLHTVIAATQNALAKQELVIIQTPTTKGRDLILTTMLIHSSGEWMASELTMPATMREGFTAQTIGSACTYSRRYALQAMIGVAADVDDDANEASGVGSKQAQSDVAKAKLEESAKSSDPKIAAAAKEGLAKINAVNTSKDLEGTLKASLEKQKDEGLFDEIEGTIDSVKSMITSKEKGARPFRRVVLDGTEMSLFEDFPLGDSTAFKVLDGTMPGDKAKFIVQRKGKYTNINDILRIGPFHWENGELVIQRA